MKELINIYDYLTGGQSMKLFISWSGEKSKDVANLLHKWISSVIQAIHPWISTQDIETGSI